MERVRVVGEGKRRYICDLKSYILGGTTSRYLFEGETEKRALPLGEYFELRPVGVLMDGS